MGAVIDAIFKKIGFAFISQGTNEILRMYIALAGMQHAGKHLQEIVK